MRVWYAILVGASYRPRAEGAFFEIQGQEVGSCAVGAIYEAKEGYLGPGKEWSEEDVVEHDKDADAHDGDLMFVQGCPMANCPHADGCTPIGIPHLNDDHKMTRPAIAYLSYYEERRQKGADPKDDALFREVFGPLEEMDAVAEAVDPKLKGVTV